MRAFILAAFVLLINIAIVYYGREHYPDNWNPKTVSFMENYFVWCMFELGCIAIPAIFLLMVAMLLWTTSELYKEAIKPFAFFIGFMFTEVKEFVIKQLK